MFLISKILRVKEMRFGNLEFLIYEKFKSIIIMQEKELKLSEVMMDTKAQIDYLKRENQKYLDLLHGFGYPEKRPQPQAKVQYWKDKYKRLMNEKIKIERERNKLYECSEKLIKVVNDNGIQVNLKDYIGITSQAGVPLIPGTGSVATINYKPFENVF